MLSLKNVQIRNGNTALFEAISANVEPGRILTIMGPSGQGKSSLLHGIAGVLEPPLTLEGDVKIDQVSVVGVPAHKRHCALLFQNHALFPHLSVGQNIALALPPGYSRSERKERIMSALQEVELSALSERLPATLSGGQRTRVALARALVSQPRAILLDEPFSSLDMKLRGSIRRFVFQHIIEADIPAIIVSHDEADIFDDAHMIPVRPIEGGD